MKNKVIAYDFYANVPFPPFSNQSGTYFEQTVEEASKIVLQELERAQKECEKLFVYLTEKSHLGLFRLDWVYKSWNLVREECEIACQSACFVISSIFESESKNYVHEWWTEDFLIGLNWKGGKIWVPFEVDKIQIEKSTEPEKESVISKIPEKSEIVSIPSSNIEKSTKSWLLNCNTLKHRHKDFKSKMRFSFQESMIKPIKIKQNYYESYTEIDI